MTVDGVLITDITKTRATLGKKVKGLVNAKVWVKYMNTKFRSMKGVKR